MKAIPLAERDGWLRHYLGQVMTTSQLCEAMQFNGRSPAPVLDRMIRDGVQFARWKARGKHSAIPVWHYRVKPLIAKLRAHGVTVEQRVARPWVPAEVEEFEKANHDARVEALEEAVTLLRQSNEVLQHRLSNRPATPTFVETVVIPEATRTLVRVLAELRDVCARPGVYLLYDDHGRASYVGISNNCIRRLGQHVNKPFAAARMFVEESRDQQLQIEGLLIKALRPAWNVRGVPRDDGIAA